MTAFHFPVPGLPASAAHARAGRKPYTLAGDGRVYRPQVQVRLAPVAPVPGAFRDTAWANAQLDTAADCCLFKQSFADELGVARAADAYTETFRTVSGTFAAWFASVRLHLGHPSQVKQFDWIAVIGFVPDDLIPGKYDGIFGVGGGLEAFAHVEVCLSPTGHGLPAVRLWSHV